MKILVVVGEFPKLSQTFILSQITGLIDRGHDVKILAKTSANEQKVHGDVLQYQLRQRTVYYGRLTRGGKLAKLVQYVIALLSVSAHRGGRTLLRIGWRRIVRQPNVLLMLRVLRAVNLTDREVILAHFGPNGLLARYCQDAGMLRGRLFVVFHGYDMLRYVRKNGQAVYRDLFQSEAILLPISDYWRQRCLTLGAAADRTIVHHMGIDVNLFQGCVPQSKKTVIIASAARFVEKKGLAYAIEAMRLLQERHCNVHYVVAGDGPLARKLRAQISRSGLQTVIELCGWRSQAEWSAMVARAQIVLAPSVTAADGDMEGIPVQLMEAMAAGKVVIATRHSGIPELIQHGLNGYLVDERDAAALADAVEYAITHTRQWPSLSANAQATVAADFNAAVQNDRLIRLFERTLHT
ncbi:MAG: glycosyltransferase [Sporolactobacillus sp.]